MPLSDELHHLGGQFVATLRAAFVRKQAEYAVPLKRRLSLIERWTREAEGLRGLADRTPVDVNLAQHLVLDLQQVVGIEEVAVVKQRMGDGLRTRVEDRETYFYLAHCTLRTGADQADAAEAFIGEALKLASDEPWVQFLAGRIAFERGQYQLAADRQCAAIRLRPQWIEAHNSLAQAYSTLGRKREADAELALIGTIRQDSSNDRPPYLSSLYQGSLLSGTQPR